MITRREILKGTLFSAAAAMTTAGNQTQVPVPAAFAGRHQPRPLSFDPAKLNGLSEKLIRSHHENNYTGAVKALNVVEQHLADCRQRQGQVADRRLEEARELPSEDDGERAG